MAPSVTSLFVGSDTIIPIKTKASAIHDDVGTFLETNVVHPTEIVCQVEEMPYLESEPTTFEVNDDTVGHGKNGFQSPDIVDEFSTNNISTLQEIPGACVPSTQKAVVTPEMGEQLNLHLRTVAVRDPSPGEAVVRILYSGICRSVREPIATFLFKSCHSAGV